MTEFKTNYDSTLVKDLSDYTTKIGVIDTNSELYVCQLDDILDVEEVYPCEITIIPKNKIKISLEILE
jgi:hypothetical protein